LLNAEVSEALKVSSKMVTTHKHPTVRFQG